MGKYVVTFLSWAAEPEMEERKLVILFLTFNYTSHWNFRCYLRFIFIDFSILYICNIFASAVKFVLFIYCLYVHRWGSNGYLFFHLLFFKLVSRGDGNGLLLNHEKWFSMLWINLAFWPVLRFGALEGPLHLIVFQDIIFVFFF